jgi:hypothetical protein
LGLAVYPSGANTDSYSREGYRDPDKTWYTTDYSSGGYHVAQIGPAIFAAEMAYHNGMTGVYRLTDAGTVPAVLRSIKRAVLSRNELDGRTWEYPTVGYNPIIWMAYRRYSDPLIEGAVSALDSALGPPDYPGDVMQIFGYPRRIAWTP